MGLGRANLYIYTRSAQGLLYATADHLQPFLGDVLQEQKAPCDKAMAGFA